MSYRGIFRKRGDAVRLSARLKKKIVSVSNKKIHVQQSLGALKVYILKPTESYNWFLIN